MAHRCALSHSEREDAEPGDGATRGEGLGRLWPGRWAELLASVAVMPELRRVLVALSGRMSTPTSGVCSRPGRGTRDSGGPDAHSRGRRPRQRAGGWAVAPRHVRSAAPWRRLWGQTNLVPKPLGKVLSAPAGLVDEFAVAPNASAISGAAGDPSPAGGELLVGPRPRSGPVEVRPRAGPRSGRRGARNGAPGWRLRPVAP